MSEEKQVRQKKSSKLRLTRFDKAVAEQIMTGVCDKKAIQEKLVVDAKEFDGRINSLIKNKYLAEDNGVMKFGIKGFNAFCSKPKKKEAATTAVVVQKKVEEKEKPVTTVVAPDKGIDLSELLAKGAPYNSEKKIIKQSELKTASDYKELKNVLSEEKGRALSINGDEVCELCKTKFKLSVGTTVGGKYGHCFCGAAYHKDCYETLYENAGSCIRCGRKLELKLDKQSRDAVKGLTELFGNA